MKPIPGTSPTEDGLIEKALRVMGAEPGLTWTYKLPRVGEYIGIPLTGRLVCQALFIHEAEMLLNDQGTQCFATLYPADGGVVVRLFDGEYDDRTPINPCDYEAPSKWEAYAQAVLAASGIEPTNSEPNEEQSVPTNQERKKLDEFILASDKRVENWSQAQQQAFRENTSSGGQG